MQIRDFEAVQFCGEVYLFKETHSYWVLEKLGGAIRIYYLKLPGENRPDFGKRLRLHESEIEQKHCITCTGKLCKTSDGECHLYRKNWTESEGSEG